MQLVQCETWRTKNLNSGDEGFCCWGKRGHGERLENPSKVKLDFFS